MTRRKLTHAAAIDRSLPPTARAQPSPRVTDRRSGTQPQREDDRADPADDEDRAARIVAKAAEMILSKRGGQDQRPAPGIRTESTRGRYSTGDYERMAQDFGMTAADLERRQAAVEQTRRQQTQRVPHRLVDQQATLDDLRAQVRGSRKARTRWRQFTEMRGRRISLAHMRSKPSLETIVADPNNMGIGQADTSYLYENGIGELVGGWCAYMALSEADPIRASNIAHENGESEWLVRTLGESSLSTGGVLVPDDVAEDYIELLYAATVYLQAAPVRMVLTNGVLTLPRVSTGSTIGWIGENTNIGKTSPAFDAPRIVLRYLAALVPWSNRLAAHSPQALQQIIVNDLVRGASVLIDTGCLRGTGTSYQPLGLENQAPAGNTANQTGTSVANITTDHAKLQRFLEDAKIPRIRPHWFMAPRTRWAYMSARDGNNNLVWAEEMAQGLLWGVPFGVTTSIPTNLGGGTNESKLLHVEMTEEIYAEGAGLDGMKVDTKDGAAYWDGSAVVSGFSQDQSVTKLVESADRVSRQNGLNIALLNQVTVA